jgi:hypothetical protein
MTLDYLALRTTAAGVLAKVGREMTLRRVTQGAYDMDQLDATDTSDDVSVTGVLVNFRAFERVNTLIEENDRKAIIAVGDLDAPPKTGDQLVVDDVTWRIIAVQVVSPAGVDVVYSCQVRS